MIDQATKEEEEDNSSDFFFYFCVTIGITGHKGSLG